VPLNARIVGVEDVGSIERNVSAPGSEKCWSREVREKLAVKTVPLVHLPHEKFKHGSIVVTKALVHHGAIGGRAGVALTIEFVFPIIAQWTLREKEPRGIRV